MSKTLMDIFSENPIPVFHVSSTRRQPMSQDCSPCRVSGLGVDLVSIPEMARTLSTVGERFVNRVFTQQELADAGDVAEVRLQRLSARFAAKEATIKALGMANAGINLQDIEVQRTAEDAPALRLHGRAARHAQALGIQDWAVSLSHDAEHAIAVVAIVHPRELTP